MTTKPILNLPGVKQLHSRNLLFLGVVLLVVVGVLLHGAFFPSTQEAAEAATEPAPAPSTYSRSFEKTPLAYTADYWLQVGEQWRPHIILVGRDQTPAIVVAPRLAVSSIHAADDLIAEELVRGMRAARQTAKPLAEAPAKPEVPDEPSATKSGDEAATDPQRPYRLLSADTKNQLAVLELTTPHRAAPVADLSELQSGAHAAALSLAPDDSLRIIPGSVVSARVETDYPEQGSLVGDTLDLSINFPAETRVAAVVDLDGGLLGVAFDTGDGLHVVPAAIVRDIAREAREAKPCISIETQDLSEQIRTVLGVTEGVFVERVRKDAFFPEPSIQAGDIIVRWAADPVPSRQAFEASYIAQQSGSLARYVILREGRRMVGATRMPDSGCRPVGRGIVPFPRLGAVMTWQSALTESGETVSGWRVMTLLDDAPIANAGIERGDLIVSAQGRGLSAAKPRENLESLEENPLSAVLTVLRGGRLQLVALVPEPLSSPGD